MASQKADKGIETVVKAEQEQILVKMVKTFIKALFMVFRKCRGEL